MKASDGHREYRKCPEMLQNCSTGFHFPTQSEETMQVTHFCFCSFPNFIRANCNEIATFFFYSFCQSRKYTFTYLPITETYFQFDK